MTTVVTGPIDVDAAALVAQLEHLRRALCEAGEPRAVIRRLADTIGYRHHLDFHRLRAANPAIDL